MKPGKPSDQQEAQIKQLILDLVPLEPPGRRFKDISKAARDQGISKVAVWRHLTRFKKLELVIHEGRFYRKNPIYGMDEPGFTVVIGDKTQVFREEHVLSAMKAAGEIDQWNPKSYPSSYSLGNLDNPKVLADSFHLLMYGTAGMYMSSLLNIVRAPNLAAAREIANIMFDDRVRRPLMGYARAVWEQRAGSSKALDTLANDRSSLGPPPKALKEYMPSRKRKN